MTSDDDLFSNLQSALAPERRDPPADRIAALRAAAGARGPAVVEVATITPQAGSGLRRLGAVAAIAVVAAASFALGGVVGGRNDRTEDLLAGGVVEFETTLTAPDGRVTATATGIRTGIGRTVQLRTNDLPILPAGALYELWFVAPNDTPLKPNRISAGTFHPDDEGRSRVDLTAAVNPKGYPELIVTAEPGDGNPAPNGPEVLRATITLDGR